MTHHSQQIDRKQVEEAVESYTKPAFVGGIVRVSKELRTLIDLANLYLSRKLIQVEEIPNPSYSESEVVREVERRVKKLKDDGKLVEPMSEQQIYDLIWELGQDEPISVGDASKLAKALVGKVGKEVK